MHGSLLVTALLLSSVVSAPSDPHHIVGGEQAEDCAFPTTAVFSSQAGIVSSTSCAAALIHPQVFVTYAECIAQTVTVGVGENADNVVPLTPLSTLSSDSCARIPNTLMWACVLESPVEGLPQTPVAYGCEQDILQIGTNVAMVGYGAVGETYGVKHWAMTEIVGIGARTFTVESDDGATTCGPLDLGGPVYVEFPDGTWHLAGIISTIVDCAPRVTVLRMDRYLPAIEAAIASIPGAPSGIDLTPCHDDDGTWSPTQACADFSTAGPDPAGATWDSMCVDASSGAPSTTCGQAFGETAKPSISIDSPGDGTTIAPDVAVTVQMTANFEVEEVGLAIDGEEVGRDARWPYAFEEVAFPEGTYTLTATGYAVDGSTVSSAPVIIEVTDDPSGGATGESGSTSMSGESSTTGSPDGEASDGSGDAQPPQADGHDASGGCQVGSSPSRTTAAFLCFVALGIRRRRRIDETSARTSPKPPGPLVETVDHDRGLR